jgi:ubiquinone/menaquinone biosynthesis C-methylase UbiE
MPLTVPEAKKAIQLYWNERSEDYDAGQGHGMSANEKEAWKRVLMSELPETGLRVLDIGCGTGELSLVLAEMGNDVVGIDLSEKMLNQARSKAKAHDLRIRFELGDADDLPFVNEYFDAVTCRHLLWTLPDPTKSLKEWMRVIKMNGRLVVIDSEWRSGSFYSRLRWTLSDLGVLLIDQTNPWKSGYSLDLRSSLPHPFGLPFKKAREYVVASGLVDLAYFDLKEIRQIQMKGLPLRHRLALGRRTYLISGLKR